MPQADKDDEKAISLALRGARETNEIDGTLKKKYRKRRKHEVKRDIDFVIEMCLSNKSKFKIHDEFKYLRDYRPYTLHWGTVDDMIKVASEAIIKNTPELDIKAKIKQSAAFYQKCKDQAFEDGDLRTALAAQDKHDLYHISKKENQIDAAELRMQILGDGAGLENLHICGQTIEPSLVKYQYIGQDENGKLVVYAEEEIVTVSDLKEAESKVVKKEENV